MVEIAAKNISVEFPIYGLKARSLKNVVLRAATGGYFARDAAERVVIRALDSISFELKEGDRVGLVGHNGSGKSTLLRVLAGGYEPTAGSVVVNGLVASMLSITLGMDMEATGYENIFLRGVIMGLTPRRVEELINEICSFSELGDYLHMPMRTYSSGMAMRLAFAVSTSVNADVVLMDEWLSAGDADFSKKAQVRLARVLDQAKILVLASHDEKLIRENCNKILHLSHGKITNTEIV